MIAAIYARKSTEQPRALEPAPMVPAVERDRATCVGIARQVTKLLE